MKNEFNKDEPVIITDENGHPVPVHRRDVEGVHVSDRATDKGRTVVTLKKSEKNPDGATLYSSEEIEDVIAVLNGDPTAALKERWGRQIVAERRRQALRDLDAKTHERDDAVARVAAEEAQKLNGLAQEHFARTAFLESVEKAVGESRSLHISRALVRLREKQPEGSARSFVLKQAAQLFGGNSYGLIVMAHEKADEPARLQEKMDSGLKAMEQRKLDEARRYSYEMRVLEIASREPNMRHEDRERLQGMMREYRTGHSDPDFRFVRDTRVNHYRNEKDIAREQEETRQRQMQERGADPEQARRLAEKVREQGRYRQRDRGMSYDR